MEKICVKYQLDQSEIARMLRIVGDDLRVEVDDETVRELPGGQVMTFDHCEIANTIQGEGTWREIKIRFD